MYYQNVFVPRMINKLHHEVCGYAATLVTIVTFALVSIPSVLATTDSKFRFSDSALFKLHCSLLV